MAMAGGLPSTVDGPCTVRMARFALNVQRIVDRVNARLQLDFHVRMGLNIGNVVAGVIGTQKVLGGRGAGGCRRGQGG